MPDLHHELTRFTDLQRRVRGSRAQSEQSARELAHDGVWHEEIRPEGRKAAQALALAEAHAQALGLASPPIVRWFRELSVEEAERAIARGAQLRHSDRSLWGATDARPPTAWLSDALEYDDERLVETVAHEAYHLARPEAGEQAAIAHGARVVARARAAGYWPGSAQPSTATARTLLPGFTINGAPVAIDERGQWWPQWT